MIDTAYLLLSYKEDYCTSQQSATAKAFESRIHLKLGITLPFSSSLSRGWHSCDKILNGLGSTSAFYSWFKISASQGRNSKPFLQT